MKNCSKNLRNIRNNTGSLYWGWRLFRLTPGMITADNVQTIVRTIQTGGGW